MYLFPSLAETLVLDEKISIVAHGEEQSLRKQYPSAQPLPPSKTLQALFLLSDKKYFSAFREKNIALTKQAIRTCVQEDQLIIQTIANLQELATITNMLSKRLREWYSWYDPELAKGTPDHETFAHLVLEGKNKEKGSMGADLSKNHVQEMQTLAQQVTQLFSLKKKHELYLEEIMQSYCPNLLALAGASIAAKLLELGRSLKQLALLPASTIQILGAEKALFRHLKTGARSPKYGILFQHPFIQKAKKQERGKAARILADKLSLCARLDYFKGEFKAEEYRKELEKKLL